MSRIRDNHRVERDGGGLGRITIVNPVLIIEEDLSLATTIAAMLSERWGCQAHVARNLHEARTRLDEYGRDYASAVCDVNLPDAQNGEVVDLLMALNIPTIAIADVLDDRLHDMIFKKGVADYVIKDGATSHEYIIQLIGRLHKNLGIKVLILADSLSARSTLTHMLKTQCLQTLVAADGDAALQLLSEHPDVKLAIVDYPRREPVIADYPVPELPGMDALAFTQAARERLGKDRLVIIGISASSDDGAAARFLKFGANDFIAKPFSHEELTCRIAQNLEMLEQIEGLREVANRDFLTGLHNRRFFFEHGQEIYREAMKAALPLVIAMMDIDNFKTLNDTYGHDIGDLVLKHFSHLLTQSFDKDLIGRLGGEEFVVLSSGSTLQDARARLQAFVSKVAVTPAVHDDEAIPFTVSVGLNSEPGNNLNAMLKAADDGLYRAKDAGRNRVC